MDDIVHREYGFRIKGNLSDTCTVNSGVPQRSILRPFLFPQFINDNVGVKFKHSRILPKNCFF